MGRKSISNEILLEWQILSKILRSLWVLDKSTHWLICSRHKSIEKHILSYLFADDTIHSLRAENTVLKDIIKDVKADREYCRKQNRD